MANATATEQHAAHLIRKASLTRGRPVPRIVAWLRASRARTRALMACLARN